MLEDSILKEVRYLKGVGPRRAEELSRLGVKTVKDLFYLFPRRYEDRRKLRKISELEANQIASVKGKVVLTSLRRTRRGMAIFEAVLDDGSGVLLATWFNRPYLGGIIKRGQQLLLYGKIDFYNGLRILSPDFEILEEEKFNLGILPVYPLAGKLTQKFMRKLVKSVLEELAHKMGEFLPYDIRQRQGLLNRVKALWNIHFPKDESLLLSAQLRFAFEELFLLQLALGMRRLKRKYLVEGISHKFDFGLRENFFQALPFKLTEEQERVLKEIEKDMASPRPMNRLLQGEVGSGKTIVACYASLIAALNGYQTAIMVPTEVLAEQQYLRIGKILSRFEVEVGILVRGIDKKHREEVREGLRKGIIKVVVGTHSLIQEEVEFANLGLVVIDEQHKFGVRQREILKGKGKVPDVLYLTATPIPRTLALTLFGDLDISTLRETPYGEKSINTYWVPGERRAEVYRFLEEMVKQGRQGFVVCPRIEEDTQDEIRALEKVYQEVREMLGNEVLLLHGRMDGEEKRRVVEEFQNGKAKVLVSTIIIEVGIDLPDASIMIIEEADRFGLSQLHQLRGRIGRAGQESFCILIADPRREEASRRLEAMVQTEDGFKISEQDLEIRGAGELFGYRQHGFIDVKFKNISGRIDILNQARREAFELLKKDPSLSRPQNRVLKEELLMRFPNI
jgi:ATP-dependent DNA helicase RecG